jgi:protocatechuate 3,4-dioxygenase beta subunit
MRQRSAGVNISGGIGATIWFYDDGSDWTTTEPAPENVQIIEWWLNEPLPAGGSGTATFQATVPTGYAVDNGSPVIVNEACANFGRAADFACDEALTIVLGDFEIGDLVWRDENLNQEEDGGELGIAGVTVRLYWDANGDGLLDDGDILLDEATTGVNGDYLFQNVPAGNFLVVVDGQDPNIPDGYRYTTPLVHAITALNGDYYDADFGFGPTLSVNKTVLDGPDLYEGRMATYNITVQNLRQGQGEDIGGSCVYTLWPSSVVTANPPKNFTDPANILGAPDSQYAYGNFAIGSGRWIRTDGFDPGGRSGTIINVDVVAPLYLTSGYTNDEIIFHLQPLGGGTDYDIKTFAQVTLTNYVGPENQQPLVWNVGAVRPATLNDGGAWQWTDFAQLSLELNPNKAGPADSSFIYVDAFGFRITTDGACPAVDQNDIMSTVPLTDTFDTDYLTFVSAEPPHSSIDELNGLISWDNVGPINPGESRTVQVNFIIKQLPPAEATTGKAGVLNSAGVTGATFVDGGAANDDADDASMNIIPTGSINGTVFSDQKVTPGWPYDPGTDLPLEDVQVTLYSCFTRDDELNADTQITFAMADNNRTCQQQGAWFAVAITTTNAAGYYEFTGLLDGYYYVQVNTDSLPGTVNQTAEASDNQNNVSGTLPDTTVNVGTDCGTCDSIWGNPTANLKTNSNPQFNPIDSPGETINGVNFGYNINPGVYGYVWEDVNGDGAREAGEPPLEPVTVWLYDNADCTGTPIATETTDANGRYAFGDLTTGAEYCIQVDDTSLPTLPGTDTWTQTGESDGSVNNQIAFTAPATDILVGSNDFGFQKTGEQYIAGNIYADWNGNANFDDGEPGLEGILVTLRNEAGDIISTTTTLADGSYQFNNLPDGNYRISIDEGALPPQYTQTEAPGQAGVCTVCGGSVVVEIVGAPVVDVNFGFKPDGIGTIGDLVWRDNNGNGVPNAGEPGLGGITVTLYLDYGDGNGYVPVTTTVTASDGSYQFSNLPPGDYRVELDASSIPNGLLYTTADSFDITLTSGQTYLDADFGFAPGGVIGNTIYWDANGNADQDSNEPGIPGVTVQLYISSTVTSEWELYDTQITNSDGEYLFTGLPEGEYQVRVDTANPPTGVNLDTLTGDPDTNGISCVYLLGLDDDADADNPDLFFKPFCDSRHSVDISLGQTYLGANFGYQPASVIGDFVWLDLDGDGIRTGGEPGIAGVVVTITNSADTSVFYTTTTDIEGYYYFVDIGVGDGGTNWTLTFETPPDHTSSAVDNTAIEAGNGNVGTSATIVVDNNGNVTSITTTAGTIDPCASCNLHLDSAFSLAGNFSISGTVFYDAGNDGGVYNDTVDTPLPGMTVYLWQGSTFLGTTVTDENGAYEFAGLPAGDYATSISPFAPELEAATITTLDSPPDSFLLSNIGPSAVNQDFGLYYEMDFGDLPDSYGVTLLSEDGARHLIPDNENDRIFLGNSLTAKADGNPDPEADSHASDDGIIRHPDDLWVPGATVRLTVTVSGGTGDGYLVGWFDWNGDGNLERIILEDNLAAGEHTVTVAIPNDYVAGTTINTRFRLYEGEPAAALPTGLVYNGEVEDYQWEFRPTAVSLQSLMAVPGSQIILPWLVIMLLLTVTGLAVHRRRSLQHN